MIIGITGTLGAGKGTVAEYLVKKHSFAYLSVRNFFAEEVLRRGLTVNRDTITEVANDLRTAHGPYYAIEQLLNRAALQDRALHQKDAVIESIRAVGEAEYLKSKNAMIWAVDADVHARYKRIIKRASATDSVSFEKFQADEAREMTSTDPNKQNLTAVQTLADVRFQNNGTQEELFAQVEAALQKYTQEKA